MKNYLIESMNSYMNKVEKSTSQKKKLDESFVVEWWGQTEENPRVLKEYGITVKPLKKRNDEVLYMFSGPHDAIKKAMSDGYFYSLQIGEDDGHSDDLDESLTEARNPENDEVNAAIRRYLNSDKAYIPKKDRDLFDRYGITPDKLSRRYGSEKIMKGPGGRDGVVIGADFDAMVHPDYDLANDLTKKKMDRNDVEQPTNDIKYYTNIFGHRLDTRTPKDTSKMSPNQFKSLQPYSSEKIRIANANDDIRRAKQREAERIEQIKQETQSEIGYRQKNKDDAVARAKAKHATKKKNESLSLKESYYIDNDSVINTATDEVDATFDVTVSGGDVIFKIKPKRSLSDAEKKSIIRKVKSEVTWLAKTGSFGHIYRPVVYGRIDESLNESAERWTDVYQIFTDIVYAADDEDKIVAMVDALYELNKGNKLWDIAYEKWSEEPDEY